MSDSPARARAFERAMAVHLAPAPWKAVDAAWFRQHPRRAHYVRALLTDEIFDPEAPLPTPVAAVAVRQLRPGFRLRVPLHFIGGGKYAAQMHKLFKRGRREEHVAHALFELFTGDNTINRPIHIDEVHKVVGQYQTNRRDS